MGVTVKFDSYTDLCGLYNIGSKITELPDEIQDEINKYFDGLSFEQWDLNNPDNVYVNKYDVFGDHELLVEEIDLLSRLEYQRLKEEGRLREFILERYSDIKERVSSSYVLLGHVGNEWHVLNR